VLLPAETGFAPGVSARAMLISAARAATLKLANQRDAAPEAPVLIRGAEPLICRWRAPGRSGAGSGDAAQRPVSGRADRRSRRRHHGHGTGALAGVLPAFLVDVALPDAQEVSAQDLADWKDARHLAIASRAPARGRLRAGRDRGLPLAR
jgi:GTP cyclohydrolase II